MSYHYTPKKSSNSHQTTVFHVWTGIDEANNTKKKLNDDHEWLLWKYAIAWWFLIHYLLNIFLLFVRFFVMIQSCICCSTDMDVEKCIEKSDLWMMCTIKSHQAQFWAMENRCCHGTIWFGLSNFLLFNGEMKWFVEMVKGWGKFFFCWSLRSRIFNKSLLALKTFLHSSSTYVHLLSFIISLCELKLSLTDMSDFHNRPVCRTVFSNHKSYEMKLKQKLNFSTKNDQF